MSRSQASALRRITFILLLLMLVGCTTNAAQPVEVDKGRYVADLRFIAQASRPRTSEHLAAVRQMCATRLAELGFEVEQQDYGTGVNVIGRLAGTIRPAEMVIVGAHYDTVDFCPGADDNGSGVAGALETARVLAAEPHARTLVVACWDEEEKGLVGSRAFAEREKRKNSQIMAVYNYDSIGYKSDAPNSQKVPAGLELLYPEQAQKLKAADYRANFVLLLFDPASQQMVSDISRSVEQAGVPAASLEANPSGPVSPYLMRSDHASFWQQGYPAISIGDSGENRNPNSHSPTDTVDTLDHDFSIKIIAAVTASVRNTLNPSD
jgi:Zn-dependent M28 family amino/carboxypeptidase